MRKPTAASRRSLGRVSVPVWLIILSDSPEAFVPHAVLLRQAFAHCGKFLTAASRRSLDRVSVPVWLIILSDQLPIAALVGHYPTNKLMGRGLIHRRVPPESDPL